ncbi:MAG: type IV secretory system conjugative DNA transfer family protein [Cyanobacteria bacterium SZAS-4]|nr:type IV secretory system conjugative DNA transfer family protein [Cyanobacteria bacterium SZAS-4]
MPFARRKTTLRAPFQSITEILTPVLARQNYRVETASEGYFKCVKQDSGRVLRTNKFVRYELTIEWSDEPRNEELEVQLDDEVTWPELNINVAVEEINNTWTGAKCKQEADNIISLLHHDLERWREQNKIWCNDTRFGSARWAPLNELKEQNYISDSVDTNSFLIGRYKVSPTEYRYLSVPPGETKRHGLVCGPTGCGKTATIFTPNLIERLDSSAIVTEATPGGKLPDLFTKTSGWRKNAGHNIYYFNPDDPRSNCVNPIDRVETVSHAQELAEIIIRNTTLNSHAGDQVWVTSERHLLTGLIMIAAQRKGDLTMVRELLMQGRKELKETVANGPTGRGRDECLAMFNLSSEGFLNGVMVGLAVRLAPWSIPTVSALTSKTDFDLAKLPDELFTFYLAVPSGKRHAKPVAAVILNFLLDIMLDQLRTRDKFAHPLMMFLDELTNFGLIPDLPSQLTILRHVNIPIVLGLQDAEQLRKVYGPSDAKILFSQPATRIFFRPNDFSTAKEISDQLGNATKRDVTYSRGFPRFYSRKLMTADEARSLDTQRAVCFPPTTDPIKLWKLKPDEYDTRVSMFPPALRKAVDVNEKLDAPRNEYKLMEAQVLKELPKLFDEPRNATEETALISKQNESLKKFTRNSLQEIYQRQSISKEF